MCPFIEINGSKLIAVPAVHYRAVFAREVNYICSREITRPDAIAVELGPHITREIVFWMKELGINRHKGISLPCMLGILLTNRMIHPDMRDKALRIQQYTRRSLINIAPELLKQLLYYSNKNLVGLSSTDSIIEAIRCSVELGIPVFGVDMDEFAAKPDRSILIQDPCMSNFNLCQYVSQNEKMSSGFRDPYTDERREIVMSARLKRILFKYKRVLFTGGLAHWEMIKKLLSDSEIKPADIMMPEASPEFSRTIIHPSVAAVFMDSYPVLTTHYEKYRHHPSEKNKSKFFLPEKNNILREILVKTYEKYQNEYSDSKADRVTHSGAHIIPDFEQLLINLMMVHQNHAPSVSELLMCGESMLPPGFNRVLLSQIMDISRPWASPKQFPELPLLSKSSRTQIGQYNEPHTDLFQLNDNWQENNDQTLYNNNNEFYESFTVDCHNVNYSSVNVVREWQWEDEPEKQTERKINFTWVWPPCEALIYGTAYEASKIALTHSKETISTVFEGSLYNGIDIKGTIRSVINCEKKIYIRKSMLQKRKFVPDGRNPEPTVFIFNIDNPDIRAHWSLLIAGTNIGRHVKNKTLYNEIVKKSGSSFISSIGWIADQEIPPSISGHIDSLGILDGYTAFGNPCINARQGAKWLEDNDYKCCPVMTGTSMDLLVKYYGKHFNLELPITDWTTTLIMIAIPYAKERIVVIAPANFRIPERLLSEAGKRNISIDKLALNYFSCEHITEMRRRIMLNANDPDGLTFPPETEKALGQRADKYFEMLPVYMQLQLKTQALKNGSNDTI